jgi:hypothetical protein
MNCVICSKRPGHITYDFAPVCQICLEEIEKICKGLSTPCPFCGSTRAAMTINADESKKGALHHLECKGCLATGPWGAGLKRTLELWNTRGGIKSPDYNSGTSHDDSDLVVASPCPFCNGKELLAVDNLLLDIGEGELYYVGCQRCGTCGPQPEENGMQTKEDAVESWNKRV